MAHLALLSAILKFNIAAFVEWQAPQCGNFCNLVAKWTNRSEKAEARRALSAY
jgi:hypothetical protein